ncbi:Fusaric acid resistance protein-like [Luteibacter sp. UNCMF331Sha3.1]|uniref:FUSC family protein n=1 Tax=Luteibacter sp. UNCMF331Sha3.1 TaxID=1502760 RepID=UPI0008B20C0C|nr:FUSC family protein [Luteibacter sp. UNCMF331Sha3.1]SEM42449.1 Fusaric acid resistance protein-like [Luteibacter sp. UNCMF331Sha3.1]
MSPPDAPHSRTRAALHAVRLHRAQQALDRLFRELPMGKRLRTGAFLAFKGALGASLAFAIGHALHTEQAFWAAISALAVTQPHYLDSRGAGRDRCIGTVLGGIAGFLGLWLGRSADVLTFAIALAGVTIVCWAANVGQAARIAGITTAIVLLVPAVGPSWEIPLYRLGEVVLGTLCALVVGWLVSRMEERVERKDEEGAT